MGKWKETALADVSSDVSYGYTESATDERVGPRFLRITDIQNGVVNWANVPYCPITAENHFKYRLQTGDIVIARTGNSTGENFLFRGDEDAVFASYLIRFRIDRHKADPNFIWYNLRSQEWWNFINNSKTGSAQAGANAKILGLFPLNLPPLPEQKAIAHILGTLDDKIELNRRMNETLETIARALFKSWFVDFEPVRAKAEGRDTGLPKHIADLFPNSFEDSELGEIPRGWRVQPLSKLCTLDRGASPRPINDFMNGEVPWVKIADATAAEGPFLYVTKEKLKTEGIDKSVSVAPGDLILSNRATCGVPIFAELHGCIHDGWLYFKNLHSISKLYLYHVLIELAQHLIHIADGSVQKNLNINLVGKQPVLVPPTPVMDAFEKQATVMFERIRQNGLETRTLAALRDTLLPKLISGEMRVKTKHDPSDNSDPSDAGYSSKRSLS